MKLTTILRNLRDNFGAHAQSTSNPHAVTAAQAEALPSAGGAMEEGAGIELGTTTGTQLGTAVDQKLGFWGASPVGQPAHADQARVFTVLLSPQTASDPPTQSEVELIQTQLIAAYVEIDKLGDLVEALRTAGIAAGIWKGSA